MPIHDWTRIDADIFHDFHLTGIGEIKRALNQGLLPQGYYALAERIAGGWEPDILTLQGPTQGSSLDEHPPGAVALADAPLRGHLRVKSEADIYADIAKAVTIQHTSDHRVVAIIEIVSPGNKSSRQRMQEFVAKAEELLRAGVHLRFVALFPPEPRDPQGIRSAIWDQFSDSDFAFPVERQLTLAAYIDGRNPVAYVEPIAVGALHTRRAVVSQLQGIHPAAFGSDL